LIDDSAWKDKCSGTQAWLEECPSLRRRQFLEERQRIATNRQMFSEEQLRRYHEYNQKGRVKEGVLF
jgi:hypothetical protein